MNQEIAHDADLVNDETRWGTNERASEVRRSVQSSSVRFDMDGTATIHGRPSVISLYALRSPAWSANPAFARQVIACNWAAAAAVRRARDEGADDPEAVGRRVLRRHLERIMTAHYRRCVFRLRAQPLRVVQRQPQRTRTRRTRTIRCAAKPSATADPDPEPDSRRTPRSSTGGAR